MNTTTTKSTVKALPNHETSARLHEVSHAIGTAIGQLQAACTVMRPVFDGDGGMDNDEVAAVDTIIARALRMLEAARPAVEQLTHDQRERDNETAHQGLQAVV